MNVVVHGAALDVLRALPDACVDLVYVDPPFNTGRKQHVGEKDAKFGLSPFHLAVMFLVNIEIAYISPPIGINLYIASFRFNRPVTEICFAVGLRSVGSFTTSFGRAFGLSPTAYRAAHEPAISHARIPTCVLLAYSRPRSSSFREDEPEAHD